MTLNILDGWVVSIFRTSCWMYSQLLFLYPDDLYARYGEEMRWVFREDSKKLSDMASGSTRQSGVAFYTTPLCN